jgi:hypothetical protein
MERPKRLPLVVMGSALALLLGAGAFAAVPAPTPPAPTLPAAHHSKKPPRVDPRGCCELDPDMRCGPYAPVKQAVLDKTDVLTGVKVGLGPIEACLAKHTPDKTVAVRWFIALDGKPHTIEVLRPVPPDVAACLNQTVGALRFPAHETPMEVPVTFPFRARRPPLAGPAADSVRGRRVRH